MMYALATAQSLCCHGQGDCRAEQVKCAQWQAGDSELSWQSLIWVLLVVLTVHVTAWHGRGSASVIMMGTASFSGSTSA